LLIKREPNLKRWSAHLIGGKKMQRGRERAAAVERAIVLYALDNKRRKRLAVNLRGKA
jgi:hypothetical protein